MQRRRKLLGVWKPEYGFCKGLANHAWSRSQLVLFPRKGRIVEQLVCAQCRTHRESVLNPQDGNVESRRYAYPAGYLRPLTPEGGRYRKTQIRQEFVAFVLKGVKSCKSPS